MSKRHDRRAVALRAKQAYVERAAECGERQIRVGFRSGCRARQRHGERACACARLKNGARTEIPCAGVFPFIGVEPNTDFLPPAIRRDDSGRVITDERMRTAEPSIFAIGALRSGFSGELTGATGEAAIAAAAAAADLAR